MADPYSTLGVGRDATTAEVRRAFRRKAQRHHPDKGGDAATFHMVAAVDEQIAALTPSTPPKEGT